MPETKNPTTKADSAPASTVAPKKRQPDKVALQSTENALWIQAYCAAVTGLVSDRLTPSKVSTQAALHADETIRLMRERGITS